MLTARHIAIGYIIMGFAAMAGSGYRPEGVDAVIYFWGGSLGVCGVFLGIMHLLGFELLPRDEGTD